MSNNIVSGSSGVYNLQGSTMMDSEENPTTNYSRWKASTEQVHVEVKDGPKGGWFTSLSWKVSLIMYIL